MGGRWRLSGQGLRVMGSRTLWLPHRELSVVAYPIRWHRTPAACENSFRAISQGLSRGFSLPLFLSFSFALPFSWNPLFFLPLHPFFLGLLLLCVSGVSPRTLPRNPEPPCDWAMLQRPQFCSRLSDLRYLCSIYKIIIIKVTAQ